MRILILTIFLTSTIIASGQQSTTGETPMQSIDLTGHVSNSDAKDVNDVTYIIPGVPAYFWRYGCGPTALGMVFGYYDSHGYNDLFPGDASTQTALVNQFIASAEHYNDYSLPLDYYPTLVSDLSEPPAGDEHSGNSIADFMLTSQSAYSNYYGWSWSSDIAVAFNEYLDFCTSYSGTCSSLYLSSYTFNNYMSEIDNNRPMMALVDTDGDGYTDHFITMVGYKQESGINYYGCHQTWDDQVHWYEYETIASGQPWGIYCLFSFSFLPASIDHMIMQNFQVYPNPATNDIFIHAANANSEVLDMQGNVVLQTMSDANGRIDVSMLNPGLYLVRVVDGETVSVGRFVVE